MMNNFSIKTNIKKQIFANKNMDDNVIDTTENLDNIDINYFDAGKYTNDFLDFSKRIINTVGNVYDYYVKTDGNISLWGKINLAKDLIIFLIRLSKYFNALKYLDDNDDIYDNCELEKLVRILYTDKSNVNFEKICIGSTIIISASIAIIKNYKLYKKSFLK